MRALILAAALAVISVPAMAGEGFPDMARFESYSVSQMKRLPDVKVPLGRRLNLKGLQSRSKLVLSLMKNSIYAQVGYKFTTASYRNYFQSRSWYRENAGYHPEKLNGADKENAQALSSLITRAKDRPVSGDNGYGYGEEGYGEDGYGYGEEGQGYNREN